MFNYIISPEQLIMIRKEFSDYEVRFTVLLVDEETIIERDRRRPEEYQMKERCIVLLNEFKDHNYPENFILDTSHLSVDETAALVLEDDRFILRR